ncbi:MAG: bifunctional diaminohydroxyphosphoribosylaminopyrimidine deaminase/5-amino-6-(5-phosphoribosylamino)uracil reductase RibD [Maioricimonas sp. JB049]
MAREPRRFESAEDVMQRALALAFYGLGHVEPNPPVGAVIVDDDLALIGEGYHHRFGGPHAEVHALADAGDRAAGATMFVTLEPCAHHGKTPPCADAVIRAGLKRVVVAMQDPAPHVAGSGIERMRQAGLDVEVGLLEADARRLTAAFVKRISTGRPWIIAKWAMTLDGRIASHTSHSQWISNPTSRQKVHELRGRCDAVMVGIGTALADDPLLTARPTGPRLATRIVVDSQSRLPLDSQLVQSARDVPLLVAALESASEEAGAALTTAGAEILRLPADPDNHVSLPALLDELGRREMTNVLVEGGAGLLGSLHDERLIDECQIFIAPKLVGGATAPAPLGGRGLDRIPASSSFEHVEFEMLEDDLFVRGWVHTG